MTAIVVRANAGRLPLPDASVDLVVTSPPYFALRSYTDGGEHYAGQIGSEPTPAEFLEALWGCTREWMRVLKPSGSIWVNLGDKYGGKGGGVQGATSVRVGRSNVLEQHRGGWCGRDKSLMGMPWRYAIGCIDQLGLILRAEVIWDKPNGLPESVTDRVRRSHEQWFHFTKQPRYFSAVDEIREPHSGGSNVGRSDGKPPPDGKLSRQVAAGDRGGTIGGTNPAMFNPLGKLPGSVWEIPSEPLTVPDHLGVDHFAAFPTEFPRRIIQGWSPAGICCECGEGRRPVVDTPKAAEHVQQAKHEGQARARGGLGATSQLKLSGGPLQRWREQNPTQLLGYACACHTPDAPTRPSLILDPFSGTGTVAMVAHALGRIGIGVDLSHDYNRLAMWRTRDAKQIAKVRGERPPVQQVVGQEELWSA